jgi:ABC-type Zn uptake system ZnuABC Zn-binding protein ZnuA
MTTEKKKITARKFKITVNYGYDVHSIIVNQKEMEKIRSGEALTVQGQGFDIEGDTEMDDWSFHCNRPNSLEVECENGHQVFDGDLTDAIISEM